jgi:hypothetical protein
MVYPQIFPASHYSVFSVPLFAGNTNHERRIITPPLNAPNSDETTYQNVKHYYRRRIARIALHL